MLNRRATLSLLPVVLFFSPSMKDFKVQGGKSEHGPSEAFRELYEIMTVNPISTNVEHISELARKAGFAYIIAHTLITADKSQRVTLNENYIIVQKFNTDGIGSSKLFHDIDDAIVEIYGINRLKL